MCNTYQIANAQECTCAHSWEMVKAQAKAESAWFFSLLGWILWAVVILLIIGIAAPIGIAIVVGLTLYGLCKVLVWAWRDMYPVIQAPPVVVVDPVAVVKPIAVANPGIAVANWPTLKRDIVKVSSL